MPIVVIVADRFRSQITIAAEGPRRLHLEPLEERRLLSGLFTVTSLSDSGAGSLRQAIVDANANAGLDTIDFNIGAGGPQTINLSSPLPTVTDPVVIDGTTQPGYVDVPIVEVEGAAGSTVLAVVADDSAIRALAIRTNGTALLLSGADRTLMSNLDLSWPGAGTSGTGIALYSSSGNAFEHLNVSNRLTGIYISSSNNNTIQCSSLIENGIGASVVGSSLGIVLNYSHIAGNSSYGIASSTASTVNAENNYWGAADGPTNLGGSGDSYTGSVDADPFLTELPPCLVTNHPPVADAGGPYAVAFGGSVQLDASGTTDPDQPSGTLAYEWDLDGDGELGETGAAAARGDETGIAPTFSAAGLVGQSSVTVRLRVTDDEGLWSEDTAVIEIIDLPDLSGTVFDDQNGNGLFDGGNESGIGGVTLRLTGTDDWGPVDRTTATQSDGSYVFADLRPGTYTLTEVDQPADFLDGDETAGTLGGSVDNIQDTIQSIVVGPGDVNGSGYNFGEIRPSQIGGLVWEDFNNDGEVNFSEKAIEGAVIELSGTDDRGNAVSDTATTDADGSYMFDRLRPGTYTITETQPAGFEDGVDSLGTVNGTPSGSMGDDIFFGVELQGPDSYGDNYNFGERPAASGEVTPGQTATIGFWQNKHGQALITALNDGAGSTQLGYWLAETFPNMYGQQGHALDGQTNAEIALFYKNLFRQTKRRSADGPAKIDAQVFAVALAAYVTNENLAGTVAAAYGFQVTEYGAGVSTFNVGDHGDAFGVDDDSTVSVLDLLFATDALTVDGLLYDDGDGEIDALERTLRALANDVFSAINEGGDN